MTDANCLLDSPESVAASVRRSATVSGNFRIRPATDLWELRGYSRLRYDVFCREQHLFSGDDRDEHDPVAHPIVAVSSGVVTDGDVVGAVRIHEASAGVWFGSRLAVDGDWRGVPSLAAGLIRCAVRTARDFGCHTFLANVQPQNVPLFRRLHWRSLGEVVVCGRPHHLMQANLAAHPPTDSVRTFAPSGHPRAV